MTEANEECVFEKAFSSYPEAKHNSDDETTSNSYSLLALIVIAICFLAKR